MSEFEPTQAPTPAEKGKFYEPGFDDNPFEKGKEIIVMRSANKETGEPAYTEGGWTIVDDDMHVEVSPGKFIVGVKVEKEVDGVTYEKNVTLDKVYELNPRVEKEPLSEAQEDIAEVALEEAGIEEVDEDAHIYSVDEIRRMREAARRVVDAPQPMITTEEVQAIAALNQQPVAAKLEEKPVDAAEMRRTLTEGLSADDLLSLRSYAEATNEVRDAQKEGRGEDSTYWQQVKGQSLRAMTPRAQSVANRYAGWYNE